MIPKHASLSIPALNKLQERAESDLGDSQELTEQIAARDAVFSGETDKTKLLQMAMVSLKGRGAPSRVLTHIEFYLKLKNHGT